MEKEVFEVHSYQKPDANWRYYKEFYTDGTSKVLEPFEKAIGHSDHKCRSYAELKRSYPRSKYVLISKGGYVFRNFTSKKDAKRYSEDENLKIKAINDNGEVVELSKEEQAYFYPQKRQKAKEIKLKQPKMTNKTLTRMSRGV